MPVKDDENDETARFPKGAHGMPEEVRILRRGIKEALRAVDDTGRVAGSSKCGIYAFYDYDEEPIYVGQTQEKLSARIGRHLTNQRTDAVAMNVLDPYEVAEIEMWPFYDLDKQPKEDVVNQLNRAEFTVYSMVLKQSSFKAVLNEKIITVTDPVALPASVRRRVVPDDVYLVRKHPDTRIARRANTIAALARVISERDVSEGLRKTLLTQSRRLERLAAARYAEMTGGLDDVQGSDPAQRAKKRPQRAYRVRKKQGASENSQDESAPREDQDLAPPLKGAGS